uniref:Ectonucleoside triphosphate diphosphohydrolase 1 n=1 Tax=Nannospalax galili TaxID=1026970 RepID=A0A8C6S7J0_NANGA
MEDIKDSKVKRFCTKNILIILGFSSVMAVIALIAVGLTQNKRLPENVKYGVVLDAGSSHTNLYIYKWPAEKENDTGVVQQLEECKVKGPGISKYAQKTNEIGTYLAECMELCSNVIPASKLQETPVYLGATAGMRLLKRSWLNFISPDSYSQETFGALDLGGASTQITFVPLNATIESPENSLQFRLYGKDYTVYTHSFLCYGKDQALWQKLAKDIQVSSSRTLRDPCFHPGYEKLVNVSELYNTPCTKRFQKTLPFDQFQIQGTGDYQKCHQSILELFNKSYCPYSQCAFDGVFLPPLQGSFGAFSAFYFVMDFFNMTVNDNVSSQKEMIEIIRKFCSKPWKETRYPAVKEKYLSEYCFSGTYILSLLLQGYNFTGDSWDQIQFMGKIQGSNAGWTLGYMLNLTNMIPAEQPFSAPLPNSTYVFLMVLFSLILAAVVITGLFICNKPSYFWKDMV